MIVVPEALAAYHAKHFGASGRPWIQALPALVDEFLDRWNLTPDGEVRHGMVALVLPVLRADGTPAVLKCQPVDDETREEPAGLRAWHGDGMVLLLDDDPATGTMLLERLNPVRSLGAVPSDDEATRILAELLARLVNRPAPAGMRRLADIAAGMLADVPGALALLPGEDDRDLVTACAAAVRDLLPEPGDRLLHWDLHFDNVLAGEREPWLGIDPKPLAGDPGFDLEPALHNRWEEVAATGDVRGAVLRRFDLMTEVLGLDRRRAAGWTLGRVLQNTLWDVADGDRQVHPVQAAIGHAILSRAA
jgi:streptomycin 6-kinase